VDAVNHFKVLLPVSPKVLTEEAMTEFGLYGLGYVELGKFIRYLDHRNQYEAAEATGVDVEIHYDMLMQVVFRIRDLG